MINTVIDFIVYRAFTLLFFFYVLGGLLGVFCASFIVFVKVIKITLRVCPQELSWNYFMAT